ncbi:hypothetical protein SEA_LUCKYLEO_73 [Gordonia phage LuckyLeo]|nr:hypothetical protein SEA_LUCKYLEO_73 [Gordonia phage LuckyLeo]
MDWVIRILAVLCIIILFLMAMSFIGIGIDRRVNPRLNLMMTRAKEEAAIEAINDEIEAEAWLRHHWEPLDEWVPTPDQDWRDKCR